MDSQVTESQPASKSSRQKTYETVSSYNRNGLKFELMVGREGNVAWRVPRSVSNVLVFPQYSINGHTYRKEPVKRRSTKPKDVAEMLIQIELIGQGTASSLDEVLKANEPLIREILHDLFYFRREAPAGSYR